MSTTAEGQAADAAPKPQLDPNLIDPAQLNAMLYAGAPVVLQGQESLPPAETTTPPSAETATPTETLAAPETQTPTEEPPAGSTPQVDASGDRILPHRIPTRNLEPEAQRALALQHALNDGKKPGDAGFVSLSAALQQVQAADNPAPAETQTKPQQPTQLETLTLTIQGTETKLAELRAQRAEMAKDGALYSEDLDNLNQQIDAKVLELADQRTDLKLSQRDAEASEAQRQMSEHDRAIEARKVAKAQALQQYPTADDVSKPLGKEVQALVQELKKPGHPNASILQAENAASLVAEQAAIRLARRAATEKGTSFAVELEALMAPPAGSMPPAAAQPGQQPPQKVLPGVGRQQPQAAAPQKTAREILAEIGTDPVKIKAHMNQGGSLFLIR